MLIRVIYTGLEQVCVKGFKNNFEEFMKRKNLHIYNTFFKFDSRIRKETTTLAQSGLFDEIVIVGIKDETLSEHEELDSVRRVWRVKVFFKKSIASKNSYKAFNYIEWMGKIFFRFRKEKALTVTSHNLFTLMLGVLFKRFSRAALVYDAHELETETSGSVGLRKRLVKYIERKCIYSTDQVIVVSDSIADWYRKTYQINNVHVIKNFPYQPDLSSVHPNNLKLKLNVPAEELLYIYQGAIGAGRGVDVALNVFSQVTSDRHIVFMGEGELVGKVKDYASRYSNIHYLDPVPHDELLSYTMSADVGIHLIENSCLNHTYCLPNKVFEYINAGIPVFVRKLPEMSRIVSEHGCGWLSPDDEAEMVQLINHITLADARHLREKVKMCRHQFDWKSQAAKLIEIYKLL